MYRRALTRLAPSVVMLMVMRVNNYGHDRALPQPAQAGNGADSAVDRHAEMVAAYQKAYRNNR